MATVAFYTLGCKVNHYESEAMVDRFKEAGYGIVDFTEKADYYIIHSCTVTNEAARKSRQYARRAKRRSPDSTVVLVGCYPQVTPREVAEIEEIDYILGTDGKNSIVELLAEKEENGEKYLWSIPDREQLSEFESLRISELRETTRAYVKIEEGCNQFCSYCIIPYARGPVRSREEASIIKEVKGLLEKGVKEIVLTGIHLGAYGEDRNERQALSVLLEKLFRLKGDFRIRLSSIEVTEVTDRLIALMRAENRFCPHLHIPFQSGSDRILEAMNRPYTGAEFAETITHIRKNIPDIALTTDVIVGFPGESKEDFQKTRRLIEKIGFSRLHVFPYSRREGTAAAEMSRQIDGNIKKRRSGELRNLNRELMLNFQQRYLDTVREVLIEENRDRETGRLVGFTDNYIRVLVDGEDRYMNQILNIKLTDSYNHEAAAGEIATLNH